MRRVNFLSASFWLSILLMVFCLSLTSTTVVVRAEQDEEEEDDKKGGGGGGNNDRDQQGPGGGDAAVVVSVVDDIWHCADPRGGGSAAAAAETEQTGQGVNRQFVVSNSYFDMECDSTTLQWNLEKMRADYGDVDTNPDTSELCQEVIRVLDESAQAGLPDQSLVELVNEIVSDGLEPCVLWEIQFGQLSSLNNIIPDTTSVTAAGGLEAQDPLGVDFSTIQLHLIWEGTLAEELTSTSSSSSVGTAPFSIDRTELHKITGQHMVEALQAHLGQDMIANLDLMLQTGLPTTVQSSLVLPVSLSGQVLFRDANDVVGTESLSRIIVNEVFEKPSALDLYLFRLRIAEDVVLTKISTVVVGDDKANSYISNLQQQSNGSGAVSSDNDTVSLVLIIVIAAVSAAFVAVIFFAYCLLCRGGGGDDRLDKTPALPVVDDDVNNYGGDDKAGLINSGKDNGKADPRNSIRSAKPSSFLRSPRLSRRNTSRSTDGIPAVNTSETAPDIEEGYNELNTDGGDISVGVSQLDDGVSEIDMDTLPPPLPNADDDDDDEATLESIDYTSGLVETEQFNYETDTYNPDEVSLAENSLYSYNGDDYSLVAPPSLAPTTYSKDNVQSVAMTETSADNPSQTDSAAPGPLEKAKKKGLLWSVMDGLKSVNDGSKQQQKDGQYETSMLGPTDNDSAGNSHDSNSLLYLKEAQVSGAVPRILQYDAAADDAETITTLGDTPTNAAFYGSGKYSEKKKKQFEELWRDEDEAEQAAAVEAHLAATMKADNNEAVTPTKEVGNTHEEAPATEKRRNTSTVVANVADGVEDYSSPVSSDDVPATGASDTATADTVEPESVPAEDSKQEEAACATEESDAMEQVEETANNTAVESEADGEKNVEGTAETKTESDSVTETSLVDRVPNEEGEEEEGENNCLPLPNALQSTLAGAKTDESDTNSVSSSHSGSSSVSSGHRGESARKKRSNWSSNNSVTSTDSAKFRALLGQSDTNDAAVVFGEQLEHQQEDKDMENHQQQIDDIQNDKSKVATGEAASSSGNGQSGQLKSLLLQPTESTDSAENDYENGEDFLRSVDAEVAAAQKDAGLAATLKTGNHTSTGGIQSVSNEDGGISRDDSDSDDDNVDRSQDIMRKPAVTEEEKKDGLQDEDDRQSASYLPAAIRSVESFESKGSADGTIISVMSTVSAAPSVDETITSQMGWF
eukprot:CAMPEP_0113519562 /NCGR_PEP_ID=MMETSP0014_2-20120614/43585_1 /TAXON_ID=2857 /ORGANISM="Nitzschia sp." /LENGTH=1198 /DNA_ID=CAMNT_0000417287 /DNA_START=384 /DNA_END=3980 /DNA_ORIENTATION=- /assembly_acc=CAM_ASM_000159